MAELTTESELAAKVEAPPPIPDDEEGPWWHLLILYTRDWIHYGALAFFVLLILAAAVRGLFAS